MDSGARLIDKIVRIVGMRTMTDNCQPNQNWAIENKLIAIH